MSKLRAAQALDWPDIESLLLQCGLPTRGARDHLAHFVVAPAADALHGCAGLEPYGTAALLRSVAVDAAHRNTGIGHQLVAAALQLAQDGGVTDVFLLTETAAPFFARRGFVTVPRDRAPAALHASAEFQGACPATATLMWRGLDAPLVSTVTPG